MSKLRRIAELAGGIALLIGALLTIGVGQQNESQSGPQTDTSFIDAAGTAHVTRVVPVPTTISPEAQKILARRVSDAAAPESLQERRAKTDAWQSRAGQKSRSLYPVNVTQETIAGVPAKVITPLTIPENRRNRVLINVHGGGFNPDSGSLTETIPIANLTQTKVVAVLYRLAPEHPFPAAVEDTVAVFKELRKTYEPRAIGLYGTSAGAILTAEVAVKLRQLGLPLPGVLGIFSGNGDFSRTGDLQAIYALNGLSGPLQPPSKEVTLSPYVASTDTKDPVFSPVYANLKGLPPTLFITSSRDLLRAGPRSCIGLFCALVWTRAWSYLKLCLTPSGIMLNCPSPRKLMRS